MDFYTRILIIFVRMISTKQTTIAMCALAVVAVLVLFASAPLVTTHQANAFWGRGWGWGGGWGWPVAAGIAAASTSYYSQCQFWDGFRWVNTCNGYTYY